MSLVLRSVPMVALGGVSGIHFGEWIDIFPLERGSYLGGSHLLSLRYCAADSPHRSRRVTALGLLSHQNHEPPQIPLFFYSLHRLRLSDTVTGNGHRLWFIVVTPSVSLVHSALRKFLF